MNRRILIVLALLTVTGALFAQTSGQINLSGTVPEILSITVTPTAAASNLDLTAAVNDLNIGTVTEFSNKLAGYTITLTSANAVAAGSATPTLEGADVSNADTLVYSLTYGGAAVTFASGSALLTDSTTKTAAAGNTNDVDITYDGSGTFLYEDTYTDTLTFTIAAK